LPEPYTDLYAVYSHPDNQVISVEIYNQRRLPNGSVSAAIAVRAESLIAYNLTFDEDRTTGETWEELDFLPLYPGHIYDITTVTIQPGGYFTIRATKFGEDESVLTKMTLVQLCVLAMHLVGAKPPTNARELAQAAADSFSIVFGPIGAIAGTLSAILEIFNSEPDTGKALMNIAQTVGEIPRLPELLAKGINLIVKEGPQITGGMVKGAFEALNVLNIVGNLKRTWNAYEQLNEFPVLVEATITLAPTVVEWPERYQVFEINKSHQTRVAFQNVSSEIWLPEEGYELLILSGQIQVARVPLAQSVRIGQEVYWDIPQRAPPIPGIYPITYQMALRGVPIGPSAPGEIVVVPENSDDLTSLINTLVEEAKREAGERFDEYVEELERHIWEAIIAEIERRLREICGGTASVTLLAGSMVWFRERRRKRNEA